VSRSALILAWLLSLAVLFLPLGEASLSGAAPASRLGLASLPWLALAGWPRRRPDAWWPAWVMAVPPLGLAVGLDVGSGRSWSATALPLLCVLACLALLAGAVRAAGESGASSRGTARARWTYGLAWLLALPVSTALTLALGWALRPASAELYAPLGSIALWNPLAWAHELALSGVSEGAGAGAVLTCSLLFLLAWGTRRAGVAREQVS
jgi:hypothetical protein